MTLSYGWQQFVERFPTARLLWHVMLDEGIGGALRAYSLAGKVVIIHNYSNDNGWTAYVDMFTTLDVDGTFDAIASHALLPRRDEVI